MALFLQFSYLLLVNIVTCKKSKETVAYKVKFQYSRSTDHLQLHIFVGFNIKYMDLI